MRRSRDIRGFTMIEVVVVVAMIAILVAVAAPIFLQQKPEQNLKEAASDLAAAVRYARSLAVSGTTTGAVRPDSIDVTFDAVANEYRIVAVQAGTPPVTTPMKIGRMSSYHPGQLSMGVFTPDGSNTIRFRRNGASNQIARVTVTEALTGRNRVVEITRAGLARIQ